MINFPLISFSQPDSCLAGASQLHYPPSPSCCGTASEEKQARETSNEAFVFSQSITWEMKPILKAMAMGGTALEGQ